MIDSRVKLKCYQAAEVASSPGSKDHDPSQDFETGCPKLAIVKLFGVLFFKEDHNILRF